MTLENAPWLEHLVMSAQELEVVFQHVLHHKSHQFLLADAPRDTHCCVNANYFRFGNGCVDIVRAKKCVNELLSESGPLISSSDPKVYSGQSLNAVFYQRLLNK